MMDGAAVPALAATLPDKVALDPASLSRLMPLHAVVSSQGRISSAGPTLARLFPGTRLEGRKFLSLFAFRGRPRGADALRLVAKGAQKLHLSPLSGPGLGLRMRGVAVPFASGKGYLVNLSFGTDVSRAVGLLQLGIDDFGATDLAIELLYLAEANAAVMDGMRGLSLRLEDARVLAEEEALTDPLTSLRNRRACDNFLIRMCGDGTAFSLMHMDLDYFKRVNDSLGHAAGDRVLIEVARVLRSLSRAMDCLARVGGDEFVIILPGLTDEARLAQLAERMIEELERPIPWRDQMCRISASIGLITIPAGTRPDPSRVLAQADVALYAAKEAGRGTVIQADALTVPPAPAASDKPIRSRAPHATKTAKGSASDQRG